MPIDFRAATDHLLAKISPRELADEIGCSLQTIRQARLDKDMAGHRLPPPGWERAVKKLAQRQTARLQELLRLLAQDCQARPRIF
jgi:hypothetical protein